MGIDTSLNISLPPPDGSGDQYSDLVVKSKTKQVVGSGDDSATPTQLGDQLSAVFGDNITSLAEAQDTIDKLNINLQLGGSLKNAEQKMQDELDNLDPADPKVPILGKYIDICDKLLQGGSVPGVTFALGLNTDGSAFVALDADNLDASGNVITQPKTNLSGTVGGNPWLAGNPYVAFLVNFMTLAKLMIENKMVESKCEVASLSMMFELGNLAAKQIITAGEKAAEMHRIAGITAAVAASTVAATTLISVGGMLKNRMKPEPDGDIHTPMNQKTAGMPDDYTPPPNLNRNNLHAVKDPVTGKQVMETPPKYVEYQGKIYRNEGAPPSAAVENGVPVDGSYRPYLPAGRTPMHENAAAGVKAVNPYNSADPYSKVDMPMGKKPIPKYEQMSVGPKQTGVDANGNPKYEEVPGAPADQQPKYAIEKKSDVRTDNDMRRQKSDYYSMVGNSLREFSTQTARSVEEFMKAGIEIEKAQADALKEIYSTISRLIGNALDRSSEGLRTNTEMYAQLIQQLDAIRAKLQEAITAALKRR